VKKVLKLNCHERRIGLKIKVKDRFKFSELLSIGLNVYGAMNEYMHNKEVEFDLCKMIDITPQTLRNWRALTGGDDYENQFQIQAGEKLLAVVVCILAVGGEFLTTKRNKIQWVTQLLSYTSLRTDEPNADWLKSILKESDFKDYKNRVSFTNTSALVDRLFNPQFQPTPLEIENNIRLLYDTGYDAFKFSNYRVSLANLDHAYQLCLKHGFISLAKECAVVSALPLIFIGEYSTAYERLMDGLTFFQYAKNTRWIAFSQRILGLWHERKVDWDQAAVCYGTGLQLAVEVGDNWLIGLLLGDVGNYLAQVAQIPLAVYCYLHGLRLARQTGDEFLRGVQLGNLANIYCEVKESSGTKRHLLKAIRYYRQAIAVSRARGDLSCLSAHTNNLGDTLKNEFNNYGEALTLFLDAYRIDKQIHDRRGQMEDCFNIAEIYEETNEISSACTYYKRVRRLAITLQDEAMEQKANDAVNRLNCLQ
jgi:tetratricopeptide (TPR) repeat protein